MASGFNNNYPPALHPSEYIDASTTESTAFPTASHENDGSGSVLPQPAQPALPSLRSLFQVPNYPQPRSKQCVNCRMASEICHGGRTCERCFLSGLRCETEENAELQTLYIAHPRPTRVIPPPPSADSPQYAYPVAPRRMPELDPSPTHVSPTQPSPEQDAPSPLQHGSTSSSMAAQGYFAEAHASSNQGPVRSVSANARLNPDTASLSAFRYPRPASYSSQPAANPPSHEHSSSTAAPDHPTPPARSPRSSPGMADVPTATYSRAPSVAAPVYGSISSTTTVSPVYQSPPAPAYIPQHPGYNTSPVRSVPSSPFRRSGVASLSYAGDLQTLPGGYSDMGAPPASQYGSVASPPASAYSGTQTHASSLVSMQDPGYPPMHNPVSPRRPHVYGAMRTSAPPSATGPPVSHGMAVGSLSSQGNWPGGSLPSYGNAATMGASSSSAYGSIGATSSSGYGSMSTTSSSAYGNSATTPSSAYASGLPPSSYASGHASSTSYPTSLPPPSSLSAHGGGFPSTWTYNTGSTSSSSSAYGGLGPSSSSYGGMGPSSGYVGVGTSSSHGASSSTYGGMGASSSTYGGMGHSSSSGYGSMQPPSSSGYGGMQPSSSSGYGGMQPSSSSGYGGMQPSSSSGYGSMGTSASSSSSYGASSSGYGNPGQVHSGYGGMAASASSFHGVTNNPQPGYGNVDHPHHGSSTSGHPYLPYPGMGPRQMQLASSSSSSLRPYRHRRSRHRDGHDVHAGFFANNYDSFAMAEQALAAEFGAHGPSDLPPSSGDCVLPVQDDAHAVVAPWPVRTQDSLQRVRPAMGPTSPSARGGFWVPGVEDQTHA
ncbi:hypothetical protein C8Q76DRAFT_695179 [Earliella scabrosa]|nr:hypothetical protein C8Q76DRAFT_695179 [Earliella scabrosa]